jgi:predicted hotdog family 3-hydroxylacyl-ACP dehydratase
MPLNRAWIEARIPHQGRMCLLDEVLDWNAQHIRCRTATHRALDNPLRSHGRLGTACGIEYAAQAMALHGALAGEAVNALANSAVDGAATGAAENRASDATQSQAKGAADRALVTIPLRPSRVGLLAAVRDVRLHVLRLDDIECDLICEVTHLAGDRLTALYEFALRERDRNLVSGRASVVLDAGGRLKYE